MTIDKTLRRVGLSEYLAGAELQFESPEQREKLQRALEHAVADDSRKGRASLFEIVRAHVVPAEPVELSEENVLYETRSSQTEDAIAATLRVLRQLTPLAGRCYHHPGRPSVVTHHTREYCQKCSDGIDAARKTVDKHVEPKECFIWYLGSDKWETIPGTGCAHYVAHELGFDPGSDPERCLAARAFRITTLVKGRPVIARKDVQCATSWSPRTAPIAASSSLSPRAEPLSQSATIPARKAA